MARYVVLINWTDQGIAAFRDSPSRVQAFRDASPQGVELRDVYWTIGPYDLVVTVDAPDDETLTAALLALGAGGNVRTTTLRAFDAEAFQGIIARAG